VFVGLRRLIFVTDRKNILIFVNLKEMFLIETPIKDDSRLSSFEFFPYKPDTEVMANLAPYSIIFRCLLD
jgi:hypothetical protein